MSLLTHEPCVNVRWTVQFSHALLAMTPARVAGAEKQGEVPCRGHENNIKSQETLMLAESQQLQNCEHVTNTSHSNGQNDELNHNRWENLDVVVRREVGRTLRLGSRSSCQENDRHLGNEILREIWNYRAYIPLGYDAVYSGT